MDKPKILAFAGSLRRDSYNKKLVRAAAKFAEAAGGDVTYIDLADYPMPIFDEDLESRDGMPRKARQFKELLIASQGILISSPEYNSSISAALKNALDWASRPEPNEPPLVAFAGKVAGLMGASPGALGGLRGLVTLRSILGNIQVLVIPEQYALNKADQAFGPDGSLKDDKARGNVENIAKRVVTLARKVAG